MYEARRLGSGESCCFEKDEPLKLELAHFIECVRERQSPKVSGESAMQVLEVALEITRQIQELDSK